MNLKYILRKHTSYVELRKDQRCSLGISASEKQKDTRRPVIKNIKHGSLAQKSHSVAEGDVILVINGQDTRGLEKKDVKRLLKDPILNLKLEYLTREACFGYCRIYRSQRMFLTLKKESGTFGFILRKEDLRNAGAAKYPIISNIKSGGPADKKGSLMAGDRLLKVDNLSLAWISLMEASLLLQKKDEAVFLVEYNVGIIDLSQDQAIQINIDCPDANLGITVTSTDKDYSKMTIALIQQGSLAQRCGVFNVGDEILEINGIDAHNLTTLKANDILRRFKKGPGMLTYVHNGGYPTRISDEDLSCKNSSQKKSSDDPFHIKDENNCLTHSPQMSAPPNSLASSFSGSVEVDVFFRCAKSDHSYDDSQLTAMAILQDINTNIANLLFNLSKNTSEHTNLGASRSDDEVIMNRNIIYSNALPAQNNSDQMSQIKNQCMLIKSLTQELTIHTIENITQLKERRNEENAPGTFQRNFTDYLSESGGFKIDILDSLKEAAAKQFVTNSSVETFMSLISKVNPNCSACRTKCYSALFAIRKVLLLLSITDSTPHVPYIVQKALDRVMRLRIPCEECETSSQTLNCDNKYNKSTGKCNCNLPRPWGVGASNHSSRNSEISTKQKSQVVDDNTKHTPQEPEIDLNVSRQSALYTLKGIQKVETDNLYSKMNFTDNFHHPLNQASPKLSGENIHSSINPSTSVDRKQNKLNSSGNDLTLDMNETERIKKNEEFVLKRHGFWKSADTISNTPKEPERSSVRPKSIIPRCLPSNPCSSTQKPIRLNKNSLGLKKPNDQNENLISGHVLYSNTNTLTKSIMEETDEKTHPVKCKITLTTDATGFGLVIEHDSRKPETTSSVPIVTAIQPKSAAEKIGLLMKGDRILAINDHPTVGTSSRELDILKQKYFFLEQMVLTVEFDVKEPKVQRGTFSVHLDDDLKLGLVMDEPNHPSIVKGLVKGGSAHRSGQVFPGDEILAMKSLREENLDLQIWNLTKTKTYELEVRRESDHFFPEVVKSPDIQCDPLSLIRKGTHFNIQRTSIRTVEDIDGGDKIVLEQEFTLFRDPQTWDFGFLFGENPRTGKAYITDIRPGGPADTSKVIKKKDRIVEVNGNLIDRKSEISVMTLLTQAEDRVTLQTRRTLQYK